MSMLLLHQGKMHPVLQVWFLKTNSLVGDHNPEPWRVHPPLTMEMFESNLSVSISRVAAPSTMSCNPAGHTCAVPP